MIVIDDIEREHHHLCLKDMYKLLNVSLACIEHSHHIVQHMDRRMNNWYMHDDLDIHYQIDIHRVRKNSKHFRCSLVGKCKLVFRVEFCHIRVCKLHSFRMDLVGKDLLLWMVDSWWMDHLSYLLDMNIWALIRGDYSQHLCRKHHHMDFYRFHKNMLVVIQDNQRLHNTQRDIQWMVIQCIPLGIHRQHGDLLIEYMMHLYHIVSMLKHISSCCNIPVHRIHYQIRIHGDIHWVVIQYMMVDKSKLVVH